MNSSSSGGKKASPGASRHARRALKVCASGSGSIKARSKKARLDAAYRCPLKSLSASLFSSEFAAKRNARSVMAPFSTLSSILASCNCGHVRVAVKLGVLPKRHSQLRSSSRFLARPGKKISQENLATVRFYLPGNHLSVGLMSWKPRCFEM